MAIFNSYVSLPEGNHHFAAEIQLQKRLSQKPCCSICFSMCAASDANSSCRDAPTQCVHRSKPKKWPVLARFKQQKRRSSPKMVSWRRIQWKLEFNQRKVQVNKKAWFVLSSYFNNQTYEYQWCNKQEYGGWSNDNDRDLTHKEDFKLGMNGETKPVAKPPEFWVAGRWWGIIQETRCFRWILFGVLITKCSSLWAFMYSWKQKGWICSTCLKRTLHD